MILQTQCDTIGSVILFYLLTNSYHIQHKMSLFNCQLLVKYLLYKDDLYSNKNSETYFFHVTSTSFRLLVLLVLDLEDNW